MSVISSSEQPSCAAAAALSSAHRRLWPAMYGDFRSMKSAAISRASSRSAPSRIRRGLRLEAEHCVPRIGLSETLEITSAVHGKEIG